MTDLTPVINLIAKKNDEIEQLRAAVEHAKTRFECLAEDFNGDESNVNWAMTMSAPETIEREQGKLYLSDAELIRHAGRASP